MNTLTDKIKNEAYNIGFDLIGITDTKPLIKEYKILKQRKDNKTLPKFMANDIEKLTSPQKHLPSAKSLISVAVSYAASKTIRDEYNISMYAQGLDYHQLMESMIQSLKQYIKKLAPQAEMISYVDTGPLLERAFARKAGLGWIGKNNNLINPKLGSYLFLGEIITNINLSKDFPVKMDCGDCRACLENCPGGALKKSNYLFDENCIGYLTQKKGILPIKERRKIGKNLWGCDTCQDVCPYNNNIPRDLHKEFQIILNNYSLKDILNFSRKNPPQNWRRAPLSWRGIRILKRNALIIIANKRLTKYINIIKDKLNSNSPIIRAYAAWTLSELDDKNSNKILKKIYLTEQNQRVKKEIERIFSYKEYWGRLHDKSQIKE